MVHCSCSSYLTKIKFIFAVPAKFRRLDDDSDSEESDDDSDLKVGSDIESSEDDDDVEDDDKTRENPESESGKDDDLVSLQPEDNEVSFLGHLSLSVSPQTRTNKLSVCRVTTV